MPEPQRTPLYSIHKSLNAKIVDFHGWEMPLIYSGVLDEHKTVRNTVGLFDVSHMGEIEIIGPNALPLLQRITTNNVANIKQGGVQYTVMCYSDGGLVDDLLVYKLADAHYLLCVNASNREKDFDWICQNNQENVTVINSSDQYAQLAIQGRLAEQVLQKITTKDLSQVSYYQFIIDHINGQEAIISRTGYTGEDGFEIYIHPDHAIALWESIMTVGATEGIRPIGLAARDTLRLEMGYMLYGNDITKDTSPYEAGLQWIVKTDKAFIGKESLVEKQNGGLPRHLVGFELIEKGIARGTFAVFKENKQIGSVTSGSFAPSLNKSIGLAYIDASCSRQGEEISIEIRGKKVKGITTKPPFYKRNYHIGDE